MFRSSHQRCFTQKGVLRNFTKFTGKHLCQSIFYNKVASLRPATLLKKRHWHRCFPVNFVKFLTTPFLQNTSGRMLLNFTWGSSITIDGKSKHVYVLCFSSYLVVFDKSKVVVVSRCCTKQALLKILQNSRENSGAGVSFQ